MSLWRGALALVIGAMIGSVAFSALRTWWYNHLGLRPNMAPEMFILLAPILAIPIATFALLVHLVGRRWFAYESIWSWFGAGISYATVLLALISPWFLLVTAFVNPVAIRCSCGGHGERGR